MYIRVPTSVATHVPVCAMHLSAPACEGPSWMLAFFHNRFSLYFLRYDPSPNLEVKDLGSLAYLPAWRISCLCLLRAVIPGRAPSSLVYKTRVSTRDSDSCPYACTNVPAVSSPRFRDRFHCASKSHLSDLFYFVFLRLIFF